MLSTITWGEIFIALIPILVGIIGATLNARLNTVNLRLDAMFTEVAKVRSRLTI